MSWLRSNGPWAALNLFAGFALTIVLSRANTDSIYTLDPGLESGKWAIRMLLICLAMTPLNSYFGWRGAIKLRKPAGLWSFGFAILHLLFYIDKARLAWLAWPMPPYIALGLVGLLILTALAGTSNRWAMRRLRKVWKRLHRLVYPAGLSVVFHALLATTASKKILVQDPQAVQEMKIYLALLVVLLGVRLPLVRRLLKQIPLRLRHQRQVDRPVTPVTLPDRMPEIWPKVNGHEAGLPGDDLLADIHPEEQGERLPVVER